MRLACVLCSNHFHGTWPVEGLGGGAWGGGGWGGVEGVEE